MAGSLRHPVAHNSYHHDDRNMLGDRYTTYSIIGIAVFLIMILIVLGVLFHELYRLTGFNQFVGYFTPTSESTWEHLKLIYTPFLVVGFILWLFIARYANNYMFALAMAILAGCAFIIVAFYTYIGIIGRDILGVDILIFILAVILGAWIFYLIITQNRLPSWTEALGASLILILGGFFIAYSYDLPNIGLFKDPTQQSPDDSS